MKFFLKYLMLIVFVSVTSLTCHIYLEKEIPPLVSHLMSGRAVSHPPYPTKVLVLAYITAILPIIGLLLIYRLIEPRFKIHSLFLKALGFSSLILLLEGELFRQPLMNAAIGNPWLVVGLQVVQSCVPQVIACFLIVYLSAILNSKR